MLFKDCLCIKLQQVNKALEKYNASTWILWEHCEEKSQLGLLVLECQIWFDDSPQNQVFLR